MKYAATVGVLALLAAACGGSTEATTTESESTSTTSSSLPTTSTSILGSTTESPVTTGGPDTTDGPPPTVPPVIAQVAFAFAGGDDPTVLVRVSVAESSDGPFLPAGNFDAPPTLTGPRYWVRFEITNTDRLGAVLTDLDISGFEAGSPLGDDVCELAAPLSQDETTDCVVGGADGFPVQPGDNDVDFLVSGSGPRQGEPDRWFDPPIPTSLEFDGARNSFVLVFDTPEGVRLDGTADGPEVEIDLDGLGIPGTVRVDCTGGSPFDGQPRLEAYVIQNFSAGDDPVGGCSEIPSQELPFAPDEDTQGGSDDVYFYFGAESTTDEVTTTVSG